MSFAALALGAALLAAAAVAAPRAPGWTLRVAVDGGLEDIDPVRAWYSPMRQINYATCLKLLNYPDGSGPKTGGLVPEAAPWPRVSSDGRTYTFQIRAGFTRFSDGRRVEAASFERALERAARLSHPDDQEHIRDIIGAADVIERRALRIRGVRARGSRLVIRLKRPAGDFLERLALPFFCAVPRNLPLSALRAPLPSAGPYYVASADGTSLVLERNRFYRGPRRRGPRTVLFARTQGPIEESVASVKRGEIDWRFDNFAYAPLQRSSWAVRSPSLGVRWLAFNVRKGPFTSARLRRAVAFALDRRALANAEGVPRGAPTDQLSPSQLRGKDSRPLFPAAGSAAGLATARKLAAGLVPVKVRLFGSWPAIGGAVAAAIAERLALLGIEVEVGYESGIECTPKQHYDLALDGVLLAYLDPAVTLADLAAPTSALFSCYDRTMRTPPATWKRRLDEANRLSGTRRLRELHRLERRLALEVTPATGLFALNSVSFFSRRVGCRGPHWVYEVDIAALCLR